MASSLKWVFLLSFGLLWSCQQRENTLFENIPSEYPVLKKVFADPEHYQVQILYSIIDRDGQNNPNFRDIVFRLDDQRYFYPASTVKLPVAILALEWLREQKLQGLGPETTMLTDSVRVSQIPAYVDSTASDGLPDIAHYVKKILLVSDNDAYNRLYELLGQDYINQKMREKGLVNTIINHRLSMPMSEEENRQFNPVRFLNQEGQEILSLPARHTTTVYANSDNPTVGKAYYQKGELINSPMDFTYKNKYALSDFHGTVQRIIFPEKFSEKERFHITEEDRAFILKYMSMLPGESDFPKYGLPDYYDSYSKFFKFGTDTSPMPSHIRIFNKTGNAYGYLLDGSYFVDFENGVEFFVTATIYTNANDTLNDDTYEYEQIAFPFFAELGEYLYQYELKRKKERKPELSAFRFVYK